MLWLRNEYSRKSVGGFLIIFIFYILLNLFGLSWCYAADQNFRLYSSIRSHQGEDSNTRMDDIEIRILNKISNVEHLRLFKEEMRTQTGLPILGQEISREKEEHQEEIEIFREEERERDARKAKSESMIATGMAVKLLGIITGIAVTVVIAAEAQERYDEERAKSFDPDIGPEMDALRLYLASPLIGLATAGLIWSIGDQIEKKGNALALQLDPTDKKVGFVYVYRF